MVTAHSVAGSKMPVTADMILDATIAIAQQKAFTFFPLGPVCSPQSASSAAELPGPATQLLTLGKAAQPFVTGAHSLQDDSADSDPPDPTLTRLAVGLRTNL